MIPWGLLLIWRHGSMVQSGALDIWAHAQSSPVQCNHRATDSLRRTRYAAYQKTLYHVHHHAIMVHHTPHTYPLL